MSKKSKNVFFSGPSNDTKTSNIKSLMSLLSQEVYAQVTYLSVSQVLQETRQLYARMMRDGRLPATAETKALRWPMIFGSTIAFCVSKTVSRTNNDTDQSYIAKVYDETLRIFIILMMTVGDDISHAEFSGLMYVLNTSVMDFPEFSVIHQFNAQIRTVFTHHISKTKLIPVLMSATKLTLIGLYHEVIHHNIGGKKLRSMAYALISNIAHEKHIHLTQRQIDYVVKTFNEAFVMSGELTKLFAEETVPLTTEAVEV